MITNLIHKKNLSVVNNLLYIVLCISFFAVVYHLFTYGISNIHSDNAVELTALNSIIDHKDIFPSSWIYGNGDINLMRIQVFLFLPFISLKKWAIAREMGALLSVLGGSFGLIFLSKKVLNNNMWLVAIPLYIVCYSGRCRDVILDSSMYSSIMLYGTLSIALVYYFYSNKCKSKVKSALGAVMLLLVNIGGVRWLAEITVPLLLTVIIYIYTEYKHNDNEQHKSYFDLLKVIIYIMIPSLIGTGIFIYVNSKCHFVVNSVSGVSMVPSLKGLLNTFLTVLGNFFICFGYSGGNSLISVYGLRDLISIGICLFICFAFPIIFIKKINVEKGGTRFVLLFAYIHNIIILLTAIFTSKTQSYHVISIVFYCIIIFSIYAVKYLLCTECSEKNIWVVVFAFSMIIESLCLVGDSKGWLERYEAQKDIVRTISKRGLSKGYGSFWNAYTHEAYSDGQLKMGAVLLDDAGLLEYNCLVDTDVYKPDADRSFIIFSQEELDKYGNGLLTNLGEPSDSFEIENAPVYDSNNWCWYNTRLVIYVFDYDVASNLINGIRDQKIEPRECRFNSQGEKNDDYILLETGGIINTPYSCVAYKGNYNLMITGTNVDELEFSINSNAPNNPIHYNVVSESDNCIRVKLVVDYDIDDMHINIQNNSSKQIIFKEIVVNKID